MLKEKGEECNMRKNCAKCKQIEYVQDEKRSVEEILIQNSQFDVDLSARREKMIQTIACYISKWNKEKLGLSENERKVIEFGMEVFLDGCVKIIVLLSIAFAFNRVKEFAVCLVFFL